jgi:hypothetical protein
MQKPLHHATLALALAALTFVPLCRLCGESGPSRDP